MNVVVSCKFLLNEVLVYRIDICTWIFSNKIFYQFRGVVEGNTKMVGHPRELHSKIHKAFLDSTPMKLLGSKCKLPYINHIIHTCIHVLPNFCL